jgi:DNA polymerase
MGWSDRQRAMLRAMGLPVWAPPGHADDAPPPPPAEATAPAPQVAPVVAAREPAPRIEAPTVSGSSDVALMDWPTLRAAVSECRACGLCEGRTQTVFGVGNERAHWMIVGEAPGEQEDLKGEPFVGAAGQLLDAMLRSLGLARSEGPAEKQVFIVNTLKCRPPRNRTPKSIEVGTCTSNYLFEQIELINPKLIVLLGGVAAKKMLGVKSINEARGRIIERDGRKYLVGYHPAVRFYREDLGEKVKEDFARLKRELKKL